MQNCDHDQNEKQQKKKRKSGMLEKENEREKPGDSGEMFANIKSFIFSV